MEFIMDYDRLFNEKGEQLNILTDPTAGAEYARHRMVQKNQDSEICCNALSNFAKEEESVQINLSVPYHRQSNIQWKRPTPVRYVDFDTFEDPDCTGAEIREGIQKMIILFASAVTSIVAIAILL